MSLLEIKTLPTAAETQGYFAPLAVVATVLTGIGLLWSGVDNRMVGEAEAWVKPVKFAASFALLFATLALVERRFSAPVRTGWVLWGIAMVMAAAFSAEMGYIGYQAARAEASHYNFSTPFHAFMYATVMGGGAVALVGSIAATGWVARQDKGARLGDATRAGIWWGFLLSGVLTLIVAGVLSNGPGHHIGLHPAGAPTLPLFGWSGVTGDLRPAHFVALHAMQVLPLLGLWLDRRGAAGGVRTVQLAAIGYCALTLAIFVQALMGWPLIPLG